MQGGDQVVVFFAFFVIEQGLAGDALLDGFPGDMGLLAVAVTVHDRQLQRVQGRPGITVGIAGNQFQVIIGDRDLPFPKAARIRNGPLQQPDQVIGRKGLQDKHLAAGQKG